MGEKIRVRPRAFVEAELQYVIGKLNEMELLQSARKPNRTGKATRKEGDISLSNETWKGNRKKKAMYSNPAVVMRTLAASASIKIKCPQQPKGTRKCPIKPVYAIRQTIKPPVSKKSDSNEISNSYKKALKTRATLINSDDVELAFSALKPTALH